MDCCSSVLHGALQHITDHFVMRSSRTFSRTCQQYIKQSKIDEYIQSINNQWCTANVSAEVNYVEETLLTSHYINIHWDKHRMALEAMLSVQLSETNVTEWGKINCHIFLSKLQSRFLVSATHLSAASSMILNLHQATRGNR